MTSYSKMISNKRKCTNTSAIKDISAYSVSINSSGDKVNKYIDVVAKIVNSIQSILTKSINTK